jgi:hypothetical protein
MVGKKLQIWNREVVAVILRPKLEVLGQYLTVFGRVFGKGKKKNFFNFLNIGGVWVAHVQCRFLENFTMSWWLFFGRFGIVGAVRSF